MRWSLLSATIWFCLGVLHAAEPNWLLGKPLIDAEATLDGKPVRLVDPAIVRDRDTWHVFASANGGTVWFSMKDLAVRPAVRAVVKLPVGRCFVPQVFWFRPKSQWHLIGMIPDTTGRFPQMAPCLCTNANLNDPNGWSKPEVLDVPPPRDDAKPVKQWIDFWVICDERKAHLFVTSDGGRLWRSETALEKYPHGWSEPVVALQGDFIYASHTYRLEGGLGQYLTTITARGAESPTHPPHHYQQSYVAERLEGPWKPVNAMAANPFAGKANIRFTDPLWSGDISHGEPLRQGNDERMLLEANPAGFIFHGARRSSTDAAAKESPCVGLLERLP
ncbi:MAG: hypothetical protein EBS05_06435 [Proteobacteria bacterium]|nr:hypothetical protein [Pseudomonadota bacterium]